MFLKIIAVTLIVSPFVLVWPYLWWDARKEKKKRDLEIEDY